jgi:hypothetical protein
MPDGTTKGDDFPPPRFPTVFTDAIVSIANSPTIVKFFLARFEPSFSGTGQSKLQPFAQVVMPMETFAATFAFFEASVSRYIEQGFITPSRLDEFRAIYKDINWRTR